MVNPEIMAARPYWVLTGSIPGIMVGESSGSKTGWVEWELLGAGVGFRDNNYEWLGYINAFVFTQIYTFDFHPFITAQGF